MSEFAKFLTVCMVVISFFFVCISNGIADLCYTLLITLITYVFFSNGLIVSGMIFYALSFAILIRNDMFD